MINELIKLAIHLERTFLLLPIQEIQLALKGLKEHERSSCH